MAAKKILLVEGTDDEHVIKHICGNRGISHLDEVKPHGSVDKLLDSVPVRLKASEDGDIVGVVIDADTDLAARWQSLRDRLIRIGYTNVPHDPSADGTIIDPPAGALLPRVGIWIMPDNKTRGILEDFLRFLVPDGSLLFDHVKASVATIPAGERRFSQLAEPKALIHSWLSWQEEPGKPLGTAITARYLDVGVVQVDELVSWLNRLFFT
ncbi:MAG TPA: hypothetical protein DET40_26030 [Lentisphaeria bacterium]|nr:MAG: hypothetical protein A2X45_12890 [Lentisphaerae bacterium GWF2_50_93]HCE47022.1 hypothetical protein [Lentisphaeria bacterium]